MSSGEIKSWFKENRVSLFILFSHNFVDFNSKSDYIKYSAMLSLIDEIVY